MKVISDNVMFLFRDQLDQKEILDHVESLDVM